MISKAWAWVKAHPWTWAALAACLALVAAFELGRRTKPTEVREVVKFQEKVVYQDRIVEKKVEVIKWKTRVVKDIHRETRVEKSPDGSVVTTTVTDSRDRTEKDADSASTVDKVEDKSGSKTTDLQTETVTKYRVDHFHFTVQAGTNFTGVPKLVWGATAEARPFDALPFWIGLWGNSSLVFGGSLGAGF